MANQRVANIFSQARKEVESSNVSDPGKNKSDSLTDYLLDVGKNKQGKILLSLRCKGEVVEEGAVDLKRINLFESQVGTKLQHVQDAPDLQRTESSFESQIGTKLQRVRGMQNLQGSVVLIPANYGGAAPASTDNPLPVSGNLSDMLDDPTIRELTWPIIGQIIPSSIIQNLANTVNFPPSRVTGAQGPRQTVASAVAYRVTQTVTPEAFHTGGHRSQMSSGSDIKPFGSGSMGNPVIGSDSRIEAQTPRPEV